MHSKLSLNLHASILKAPISGMTWQLWYGSCCRKCAAAGMHPVADSNDLSMTVAVEIVCALGHTAFGNERSFDGNDFHSEELLPRLLIFLPNSIFIPDYQYSFFVSYPSPSLIYSD